jgi:hypothetical protein
MERFPHIAAENFEPSTFFRLNTHVDQFARAMKRSTSPNTGSQPIETSPRAGGFLIPKEDARGKDDIDRSETEGAPQRQFAGDYIVGYHSDDAFPRTVAAVKTGPAAVEPKRAYPAFSIAGSLVVAACAGIYFRAEVTSYVARHTVHGDLFGISTVSGQAGQVSEWLTRNFESQVPPTKMSQGRHTQQQVDASALSIAARQHQAEVNGIGAQASGTTPVKAATLPEPSAVTGEHSQTPAADGDPGATLASELAITRRDVETKAALLSKAADEAAQVRQTTEAASAELRQSLLHERDRVAVLARELATARRDLETEVALARKAGEEVEQLRQAAKATATGELEQERNRSTAAHDPESAQRVNGASSTTERTAGGPIVDEQVAEQLRRNYRAYRNKGKRTHFAKRNLRGREFAVISPIRRSRWPWHFLPRR